MAEVALFSVGVNIWHQIWGAAFRPRVSQGVVGVSSFASSSIQSLDVAIKNRQPATGGTVHADHGVQFTSWGFTNKIRASGLMPSFGTVGDCYDNSMMESFWSSMQIELLNREKWRTRVDLANAIFNYIEILTALTEIP